MKTKNCQKLLKMNIALSGSLKEQVEEMCEDIFGCPIEDLESLVNKRSIRKLESLANSKNPSVKLIVEAISELLKIYFSKKSEDFGEECKKRILVGVVYFLEADDVIPDYVPGEGYLDDIYALQKSIKIAKKLCKNFNSIF